jgi:hypothetical protein
MTTDSADRSTLPSPGRRLAFNLSVAVFLGGSALSLFTQRDFWPFSPYPMFAALQPPAAEALEVVGVGDDDGEVSLAPSRRTSIVAGTRYRTMLERLLEEASESDVRTYLVSAARQYEHAHAGTPLRAARLYRSRWQAVPDEWPPARRRGRQLLAEVILPR